MTNENDMTRQSPQQLVQQRELRNNSTLAIANTGGVNLVLTQSNAMGLTKRHVQGEHGGSSKWLPSVPSDKKKRVGGNNQSNNTHTIQIGKGEI